MWIAERKVDVMGKSGSFESNLLQELILSDVATAALVFAFGHLAELPGILVWWRRFRYSVMGLPVELSLRLGRDDVPQVAVSTE